MIRVLHFSDVHVEEGFEGVPKRAFLDKRLMGFANLVLRRRQHYRHARERLAALADFAEEHSVDVGLCTGDYTALGTDPELIAARQCVERLTRAPLGFVTMPGNHDMYVAADGAFERHFGDLLRTDMPEHAVDGTWPQVRLFGDELAIVAVASARPNPEPWRSSGRVPDDQLQALGRIFADERLASRVVLVATHYAPRLEHGGPDTASHGLDNADDLLAACAPLTRGALVHGHVHRRYTVNVPELQVPLIGAGSTTHHGREGFWLYDIEPGRAVAQRGTFDGTRYLLEGDPVALQS
jgi:3',5'-cyclic AMP phosphodiesterase CpdA